MANYDLTSRGIRRGPTANHQQIVKLQNEVQEQAKVIKELKEETRFLKNTLHKLLYSNG